MKKHIKGFLVGVTSTLLIVCLITSVFAATGEATFSPFNIVFNGNKIASAGDSYTLANGASVPFSLSYGDTTYMPVRKLAELLGVAIDYDGITNSVLIGKDSAHIGQSTVSADEGKLINTKGLVVLNDSKYLLESYLCLRDFYLLNGNIYIDVWYSVVPVALKHKAFTIDTDANNQFVDGVIDTSHMISGVPEIDFDVVIDEVYISPTESASKVSYSYKGKTLTVTAPTFSQVKQNGSDIYDAKINGIHFTQVSSGGLTGYMMNYNDFCDYFGLDISLSYITEGDNTYLVVK